MVQDIILSQIDINEKSVYENVLQLALLSPTLPLSYNGI